MYTNRYIMILGLGALVSLSACDDSSDGRLDTPPSDNRTEPDNTEMNEIDRSQDTRTPIDQSQSSDNIEVTADIRRAIMDDDRMSMNAQNCKIITDESGHVTLRGVVNSQAEKDAIDATAKSVAGVTRVDNYLEVKTN